MSVLERLRRLLRDCRAATAVEFAFILPLLIGFTGAIFEVIFIAYDFSLASEATRSAAGSGFEWRRLDRVAVAGRQEGTLVFELLGEAAQLPRDLLLARDRYEAALDAYFARRFAEAAAAFADAARLRPEDRASALMAERARELAQHPPGEDWSGVFVSLLK